MLNDALCGLVAGVAFVVALAPAARFYDTVRERPGGEF